MTFLHLQFYFNNLESMSSMSSSASLIPSPGVPVSSVPGGNLLSSVPPPSDLPSFITTSRPVAPPAVSTVQPQMIAKVAPGDGNKEPFYPTAFR